MASTVNETVTANKYAGLVQWIEGFGYAFICFLLPFALGHTQNQLFLGSIVNAMIILAAVRLKWKHSIPVILMPSLGVLAAGALFAELTPFMFYLVPFIWSGNALLTFVFKKFKDMHFAHRALIGAVSKTVFIGAFTALSVFTGLVPEALLIPMSAMQLLTAAIGSAVAFTIIKLRG